MFSRNNKKCLFLSVLFAITLSQGIASSAFAERVYTENASSVGTNTAILNAEVTGIRNYPSVWFEWGTTSNIPFSNTTPLNWSGGDTPLQESIFNLSPNTTYFFRVAAQYPGQTLYGKILSFKTKKGDLVLPVINTSSASSVNRNSATIGCFLDPQGNTDTERWVEWGTTSSLGEEVGRMSQGTSGSYFVALTGLSPDTAYYFRCVASTHSDVAYGNIFSFRTSSPYISAPPPSNYNTSNNNSTPTFIISTVVATKLATEMTETSARVNAIALPGTAQSVSGWFEWGSTPDFGNTSIRRYLGTGGSIPFGDILSGLVPGTTYFFRPVVQDQNGLSRGVIFSFRTTGTSPFSYSGNSNNNGSNQSTPKLVQQKVKLQPAAVAANENIQTLKVKIIPNVETAAPKERINETIEFENTRNAILKDTVIRVILPDEMEYISTGGDDFIQNGKTLLYKIGDIKPTEKTRLLFWATVGPNIADKTILETIVVVTWEDKTHPDDTQSVGRATITIDTNKAIKENIAAASAAKSASSFSLAGLGGVNGWCIALIGFLFLLLLILAFLVFRRKSTTISRVTKDNFLPGGGAAAPEIPIKRISSTKWDIPDNLPT